MTLVFLLVPLGGAVLVGILRSVALGIRALPARPDERTRRATECGGGALAGGEMLNQAR